MRKLEERPDWPACKPILMQVLKLLREGMQWSLDYAMGVYIETTKGEHPNSNLEDWYKEIALKCLSQNNLAESLFGYARSKDNRFQAMLLSTVGEANSCFSEWNLSASFISCQKKRKEKALAQPGKKCN